MSNPLWGAKPHSLFAVLDSASNLDKHKYTMQAMNLIRKKPTLTKRLDILNWVIEAKKLLNLIMDEPTVSNSNVDYLNNLIKGKFDNQNIGLLLTDLEANIFNLDGDELLNQVAHIAHKAISHWAELELNSDV